MLTINTSAIESIGYSSAYLVPRGETNLSCTLYNQVTISIGTPPKSVTNHVNKLCEVCGMAPHNVNLATQDQRRYCNFRTRP